MNFSTEKMLRIIVACAQGCLRFLHSTVTCRGDTLSEGCGIYQVRRQAQSTQLTHTVLSGLGLLLSCSAGLEKQQNTTSQSAHFINTQPVSAHLIVIKTDAEDN